MKNETEPTWENQLKAAMDLYNKKGLEGLEDHARIGMQCKCHSCFCCAALVIWRHEYAHKMRKYRRG